MDFHQLAAAFTVIAGGAGSHYIGPDMLTTQVFRQNMVDRQIASMPATVLADEVITTKNLPPGQFDLQTGAMDHMLQTDNGWPWEGLFNGLNCAAAIHYHTGFPRKDQANGATGVANIDRLKIGVENQYRRVHSF